MRFALFALLVATGASAQDIYRCTGGGRTTYQSTPCVGAGTQIQEDAVRRRREQQTALDRLDAAERARQRKDAEEAATREFQARLDKRCGGRATDELRAGMTEVQLLNCTPYRKPAAVNTTTVGAVVSKQYVFDFPSRTYVYFRDGKLTAIQQ